MLSGDNAAIIQEPDTVLCISTESVEEIINAIKDEFFINIIPIKTEHLRTYARLRLNTQQDHKDPSDHVIISHAITEHLPLISSDTRFGYYRPQGLDFIYNQR